MNRDEIERLLASRKTEDRIRAFEWINSNNGEGWIPELMDAMDDRVPFVAAQAARTLSQVATLSEAPGLLERFVLLASDGPRLDPGCHLRTYLAYVFGRLEFHPAADALRVAIVTVQIEYVGGEPFDAAAQLRANAALALAEMRAPDALRDISILLFRPTYDDNPGSRCAAAKALGRLGDPAGIVPLALMLQNDLGSPPELLADCMDALVEMGDERILEVLEPYLQEEDQQLAARAALALAKTRRPEVPGLIKEAVSRLQGGSLNSAILALGIMRLDESEKALCELALDSRDAVRKAVVEALAVGRSDAGMATLAEMAKKDASSAVRMLAAKALGG